MKMARISITVHTNREAVYTEAQYNEVRELLASWARGYVENVIKAEPNIETHPPDVSLDNFINDLELPTGPIADALSKDNTTVKITVK